MKVKNMRYQLANRPEDERRLNRNYAIMDTKQFDKDGMYKITFESNSRVRTLELLDELNSEMH